TGTITQGRPTVEKVGSFNGAMDPDGLLQYIVSLNANSEHPLAEATLDHGRRKNVQPLKSENFSAITGMGVEGIVQGKKIALGNPKLMERAQAGMTPRMEAEAKIHQQQGKTV